MTGEIRDPGEGRRERTSSSELPTDRRYWTRLADRIEAESAPVLRESLERSMRGTSKEWYSLAWLAAAGRVGRWVVPVAAVACALWMALVPTGVRGRGAGLHAGATVQNVVEDLGEEEDVSAWRTAVSPNDSIGRLFGSSSPPSIVELLPWAADALRPAESISAEGPSARPPGHERAREEVNR